MAALHSHHQPLQVASVDGRLIDSELGCAPAGLGTFLGWVQTARRRLLREKFEYDGPSHLYAVRSARKVGWAYVSAELSVPIGSRRTVASNGKDPCRALRANARVQICTLSGRRQALPPTHSEEMKRTSRPEDPSRTRVVDRAGVRFFCTPASWVQRRLPYC